MVSVLSLFLGLLFRPVRAEETDVPKAVGSKVAIPALIAATATMTTA
jgi:hypothetical protein